MADYTLQRGRYYCWWINQSLYYTGKTSGGLFVFEDITGGTVLLDVSEVEQITG